MMQEGTLSIWRVRYHLLMQRNKVKEVCTANAVLQKVYDAIDQEDAFLVMGLQKNASI